jgi:hypothetical protein
VLQGTAMMIQPHACLNCSSACESAQYVVALDGRFYLRQVVVCMFVVGWLALT